MLAFLTNPIVPLVISVLALGIAMGAAYYVWRYSESPPPPPLKKQKTLGAGSASPSSPEEPAPEASTTAAPEAPPAGSSAVHPTAATTTESLAARGAPRGMRRRARIGGGPATLPAATRRRIEVREYSPKEEGMGDDDEPVVTQLRTLPK